MKRRNVIAWNTMVSRYVKTERYAKAVRQFRMMMMMKGIRPSTSSFVNVFPALSSLGDYKNVSQLQRLDLAQQLHAYIIKNLATLPAIVLHAIIVMYSRCGFVHTSFKAFDNMLERDVVSWNTMISAFVQNGLDDEGLMLVYEMQKQQFMIDSVTVTALLSPASDLRNRDIGKQTMLIY
ncbi:hypothetical protein Pint_14984 [Pistacia integerrima]|uniref:Uncharacterized protein n=1 Tax=Pistacia integerrima TaxID=434235 RepID=A0ACC0ZGH7_9ROSI|nr:hypothetical protein Pint_14984 [Pistacia integerrima]